MTNQHTDEMREAFERFYVQKYGYSPAACLNQRNADGSYSPPDREYQQIQDQRAWEAYQAATAYRKLMGGV